MRYQLFPYRRHVNIVIALNLWDVSLKRVIVNFFFK